MVVLKRLILVISMMFTSLFADGYAFELQEDFEPYEGVIVYGTVNIRSCPSLDCSVVKIGKEREVYQITGITKNGEWYQLESKDHYIKNHLIKKNDNPNYTKDTLKELVTNKFVQEITTPQERTKVVAEIETTVPNESDSLYIHSPELAEKYRNNALIANLTQSSSPKPVMKAPRYARVLIFPILNEGGDVYYDYNYAWVKIQDESFILGQREGKETTDSFFSIHRKVK